MEENNLEVEIHADVTTVARRGCKAVAPADGSVFPQGIPKFQVAHGS